MATAWYNIGRNPTTNISFNQTSNLIMTELGGGYFTRYLNGTARMNQEFSYEYDYLTLSELAAFETYLKSIADGQTIDLPDYSADYSGATTITAFMTGYTKGLSQNSTSRWTVNISFRGIYE